MKNLIACLLGTLTSSFFISCNAQETTNIKSDNFVGADNPNIQYTGRIDFTDPKKPRFWSPGVYIQAKFSGTSCDVVINDEVLWGTSHNYLEVVIDDAKPLRIQTTGSTNTLQVAKGLTKGEHVITICKNTEAGIGYLEFVGFHCEKLLPLPAKPIHKLEFVGNSITCGAGMDLSVVPCDQGQWYDQHNAYLSYGPTVARKLNAQWHLTGVSGIGLIHSCCNMTTTMPQVFDKVNLSMNIIPWDFNNYQPDAITITLGQNDGVQDSTIFCTAYVDFIKKVRGYYPQANIILLTSPMGDATLTVALKKYLTGIVNYINGHGDKNVHRFFYSRSYNHGCGGHPDMNDHQLIAEELTNYLKGALGW